MRNVKETKAYKNVIILISIITIFFFFKSMCYYGTNIRGSDGQMYYAYVRSFIIDRDLDFRNEFQQLTPFPEQLGMVNFTKIGYVANKYPIGYGLVSLPFFILAHFLSLGLMRFGYTAFFPNGYSFLYSVLVQFGHVIYGIVGVIFGYKFLANYFEKKLAILSILTIWFSTSLIYYGAIFTLMPHVAGFCFLNIAYYLSCKLNEKTKWLPYAFIGISMGLTIILRPSNILLLLYPAYIIGRLFFKRLFNFGTYRKFWLKFLLLLGCLFCIIFMQFLVWRIIYGSYLTYSYGEKEKFFLNNPQLNAVLFSSNHGLFYWAPVTLIAVVGLLLAILKNRKIEFTFFLFGFVLLLYCNASWHCWWFGDAFGARAFSEAGLIFSFGLAYFMKFIKQYRLSMMLSGVFILWNFYLLQLFVLGYLPRAGTFQARALLPFIH